MRTIGVIGGSGLYDMPGLEGVEHVRVTTPFGDPSDEFVCGTMAGMRLVFLPRHGRGHRLLPSELNFRANIFGMKQLGAEWVIGVASVGSMREEIAPGHLDGIAARVDNLQGWLMGQELLGDLLATETDRHDPVSQEHIDFLMMRMPDGQGFHSTSGLQDTIPISLQNIPDNPTHRRLILNR